jgi:hypothetical protein
MRRDYYFEEARLTLRDNEAWNRAMDEEVCIHCGWERRLHNAQSNACPSRGDDPLTPGDHTFSKTQRFETRRDRGLPLRPAD